MKTLSIIIPAYDEAARIGRSLELIIDFLRPLTGSCELIVVDDGSKDGTIKIVEAYRSRFTAIGAELHVLRNPGNRGKGYSVRQGMLRATGEVALFTDADLSAPISEAHRLLEPILSGRYDVAFGSRALSYNKIKVHQSAGRELIGRTFNRLMKLITGLHFQDTQCGFKAFRRGAVRPIFTRSQVDGFGFDVELLYIAQKLGLHLLEVPVEWSNVAGSKVGAFNGLKAFTELLAIRWNDLLGRYGGGPGGAVGSEEAATD